MPPLPEPDIPRLDDDEARSFCLRVMQDGRGVQVWHPDEGYEYHSARIDALAAKRGDELMIMVRAYGEACREEGAKAERERLLRPVPEIDSTLKDLEPPL